MNETDVAFLLDTGALLQSCVCKCTGAMMKTYNGSNLVESNGSPIPACGSASVTIKLGSRNFVSPQNNGDIACTSQVQHSFETGNTQHVPRTAPSLQELYR